MTLIVPDWISQKSLASSPWRTMFCPAWNSLCCKDRTVRSICLFVKFLNRKMSLNTFLISFNRITSCKGELNASVTISYEILFNLQLVNAIKLSSVVELFTSAEAPYDIPAASTSFAAARAACAEPSPAAFDSEGNTPTSPSTTTRNWAFAPEETMASPSWKVAMSNLSIIRFCCSSESCLKNPSALFLPTLSTSNVLIALRRKTSSTGPNSRSSEDFPKAKQVTVSMALAPDTWCFVYMSPALPSNVPAFLTACVPKRSTVCTLPSTTMNIQSPTSPSRKICSPRPKT
mmetsp:Transcript_18147/g.51803  ORF Transcript_18147/g.51803 Transcript_18147/m.51803 type:complete len:289 (-) Transcript_18147:865-1731(-)